MKMYIPEEAEIIIRELMAAGFEAYAVGGCVRDSILGRVPEDWDITTSARPEQVKKIFPRTVDTGIEHGTVTVLMEEGQFEVTTYRIDGEYEDHRHPKEVAFTASLEEDLKRRDFTINAMAYNSVSGLVDIFHGMEDLKNHRICCVGKPEERFEEDALRILRAIRFSAQLDFEIDKDTEKAMQTGAPTLADISAERIRVELVKLLVSDHPEKIHKAWKLGLTKIVLPEYDGIVGVAQHTPNHIYDVEKHTLIALENISAEPILRWTMLLHDFGKPVVKKTDGDRDIFYKHPEASAVMARKIMKRLKFDNYTADRVCRLVKWHGLKYFPEEASVRRALNRVGRDIFDWFILVQQADISAKNPEVVPGKLELLRQKEEVYHQIIERGDCFEVKSLAVNGRDLIQAGILQGPTVGAVLERLVELVIDDQSLNTKAKLLELGLQVKDDPTIFDEKDYFFS
ncbi:MAG: CCA tRNA nucleotidyltransferase [Clostridia bacterium]|nr:CCA tRNA nucleotidyltransferase [Clostridia bacterium]NCD02487.1 CCA tRNA nucleotidyltransferase [Clostridia bacterium]